MVRSPGSWALPLSADAQGSSSWLHRSFHGSEASSALADILIPRFAPNSCCVEVFAEAAAFFLRPPVGVEASNGVNDDLINPYRGAQQHLEEFMRQFKWALTIRKVFRG
jgi:hypothetical protein